MDGAARVPNHLHQGCSSPGQQRNLCGLHVGPFPADAGRGGNDAHAEGGHDFDDVRQADEFGVDLVVVEDGDVVLEEFVAVSESGLAHSVGIAEHFLLGFVEGALGARLSWRPLSLMDKMAALNAHTAIFCR